MEHDFELNRSIENNFRKVELWLLIPPLLLITLFFLSFWLSAKTIYFEDYVESQRELFFYINGLLAYFPNLQYNITHLGDVLIFFPFVFIFLFYAPRLWQALLTSSLITLIISALLKRFFAVPRPAAMFDNESFLIMGRALKGHTSFPSGHSITCFMIITILLYGFMPKKNRYKLIWTLLLLAAGCIIAFSRVGVGAHYPFDVIIGGTIGYIAAIIGIAINKNINWLDWVKIKKFHPIFILIFFIWGYLIIKKITGEHLPIFYISLVSLVITLFIITKAYVKKN